MKKVIKLSIFITLLQIFPVYVYANISFYKVKPNKGAWGDKVFIYGKGFKKNKIKVYYDGKQIQPIKVSFSKLTIIIPKDSKNAWIEVEQDRRRLRAPSIFIIENYPVVNKVFPLKTVENSQITVNGKFLNNVEFYLNYLKLTKQQVNSKLVKIFIPKGANEGFIYYKPFGKTKIKTKFKIKITRFPIIKSVFPLTSWYNVKIKIRGKYFCKNPAIYLNNLKLKITYKNSSLIEGYFPSNSFKIQGVPYLKCYGKKFSSHYNISLSPRYGNINKISPNFGYSGSYVDVYGEGFSSKDSFWLGSTKIKIQKFINEKHFKIKIPSNASSGNIHYKSYGKFIQTDFLFKVIKKVMIFGFYPKTGWYGSRVIIQGKNLCINPEIYIRNKKIQRFRWLSSSKLLIYIPRNAKSGKIKIKCIFGKNKSIKIKSSNKFRVLPPKIKLHRVIPTQGITGQRIVLKGENFPQDLKVKYGSHLLKTIVEDSKTAYVSIIGKKTSFFTLFAYGKTWKTNLKFKIIKLKPQILSVSSKISHKNALLTIFGKNFCQHPLVYFRNNRKLLKLKVKTVTNQSISFFLNGVKSDGFIEIKCFNYKIKSPFRIRIQKKSSFDNSINSIFPLQGPVGTVVTIEGNNITNFDFYLDRTKLALFNRTKNTVIVKIPENSKGGYFYFAPKNKRLRPKKLPFKFTIKYPKPIISFLSKDIGWINDKLEIKGSNFCPNAEVYFANNAKAKIIKRISHTYLKVLIPKQAKSGYLKIKCYGAIGVSRVYFTMAPPYSRIISVTPQIACPKDKITIKGVNFTSKTKFYIGAKRMKIKKITSRKALVVIPMNAISGDVKVESFGKKIVETFSIIIKTRICKKRRNRR